MSNKCTVIISIYAYPYQTATETAISDQQKRKKKENLNHTLIQNIILQFSWQKKSVLGTSVVVVYYFQ